MDLRETVHTIRVLLAVTELGSFSAAASKLNLTPSAVSKTVSRAEARLGARLVQRTTRRVRLTDLGEGYLARGRQLVGDLWELEAEIGDRDAAMRGPVRVAAPSTYGAVRVAPVVAAFQREHPDVRVSLRCDDRMHDLVAEGIDVAIRMLVEPPAEVVARVLADDRRGLYASPAYLKTHRAPKAVDALVDHALLRYGAGEGAVDLALRAGGAEMRVKAPAVFSSDNVLAVREAACAGLGIAELPEYLVEGELARGRLVEVLPGVVPTRRRVYAVYLPSRYQPARVRALLDRLVRSLRG
ncbi:Transcriptional regulator, LysR family protein [Minicystis rosea]|nr:Transcriptional regulator, LysR family protein [Minicystis rosea]